MGLFSLLIALAASQAAGADVQIQDAHLNYARPANTLGYSAIVKNAGPDVAENVEVWVFLPPGAVARNAEPSCESHEAGAIVRCALCALRPDEERRVFMLVLTSERAPMVRAAVTSATPDPDASNNTSEAKNGTR
jgi:uncharacterized repeat protein (TIGR01451 family)